MGAALAKAGRTAPGTPAGGELPHGLPPAARGRREKLLRIYRLLLSHFGPSGWWPAESAFEVMVGAILTQNTAWANVERAIANLKGAGLLSFQGLREVSARRLARLIRPAGYFNQKARYLKELVSHLEAACGGDLSRFFARDTAALREEFLRIKGIGPETADSILLYAGGHPAFTVDAYTRRSFARLGLIRPRAPYEEIRRLFQEHLPPSSSLFNEYHALIVRLGKNLCLKSPRCGECPLQKFGCRTDL
ncbi:MAG: endonuclease III domain-containing protein [Nitrospinota bacterium]